MTATIYRLRSTDQGTFGVIVMDGFMAYTLECPDRDNQPNISCIPTGEYKVRRRKSPHFGETYHVQNVPGRSYILIHAANFAGDESKGYQTHLAGCISLGLSKGTTRNKDGNRQECIFSSAQAVRNFEDALDRQPFNLIIKDMTDGSDF